MSDLTERLRRGRDWISGDDCDAIADALEAAEAELARLEHQLQQAEEATTAAYKDAETAEARSADLQARSADLQTKLDTIRTHCQDNLAARSMGDYENGYDGACLDILDILEEK